MLKKFLFILLCFNFVFGSINIYAEDETTAVQDEDVTYGVTESFDINSGMFIEKIDDGIEFVSSIPNGAVVSDGVYFEMPLNIAVELQKDGDIINFYNKTAICMPGYYIMKLTAVNSYGQDRACVFTFRIADPPSNKVNTGEYKYPKISCTANITMDTATGLYKYTLPNYKAFFADISQYGQNVESARFIIPRNLGYSLKRNGREIGLVNNKVYNESGNYTLKIFGYSYGQANGYDACYETVLNFTIPAPVNNETSGYTASISESIPQTTTPETPQANVVQEPAEEGNGNIINDSLLESYFESANIYSETFSTGDAFYTNTPNNGIVGGNVYFDIPYNMSVSMTKDGTPAEFKNKTYINEEGSYIMLITDVYDGETVTAGFSFRIQSGVEASKSLSGEDTTVPSEESEGESISGEESRSPGNKESSNVKYDLKNQYDEEMGMYVFDCGDEKFYASVPDGMFSNYEVILSIPDSMEAVLKRNGEEIEYSDDITEDGRYELEVKSETGETSISFDIAAYSVNYMDEFTAPEGYSFIVAEYSDYNNTYSQITSEEGDEYEEGLVKIEEEKVNLSNVFELPIDGQYDFILQGSRGMPILSATILLDTKAPEIQFEGLGDNMRTEENSIEIYCSDTDAQIVLTDAEGNEEIINMTDGKAVISGDGRYRITARDSAGNENEYSFVLGSSGGSVVRIVTAAMIFILALIILVIILMRKGIVRPDFYSSKGDKKVKDKKEKKEKSGKKKSLLPLKKKASDDSEKTDTYYGESSPGGYDENDGWEESAGTYDYEADNDNYEDTDDDWENS